MSRIRLKPEELDLIALMIDKRDSAHLSGHRSDPFRAASLNGGVTVLHFPGRTGADQISTMTFERFLALDLFHVFSRNETVTTFDLADDIRDRLELLKEDAGQPNQIAQERNARARAEDRQSRLETALAQGHRERQHRREVFGASIGRTARWAAVSIFLLIYGTATVVGTLVTGSAVAIAVAVGILLLIGILDWIFHLDAYRAVRWVEAKAAGRAERWAGRFEADDADT